jgi:hypothetical protein
MERLQALAAEAHFVKAFSCIGNAFMVNPDARIQAAEAISHHENSLKQRAIGFD